MVGLLGSDAVLKKLAIILCAAAVAAATAWASGLPEVYKPKVAPKPKERVEKPVEHPLGAGLHDLRVVFDVGGVAPDQLSPALLVIVPVLERRAAGLGDRWDVAKGPAINQVTVEVKGCADADRALAILATPGRLEFEALVDRDKFLQLIADAGWPASKIVPYDHRNLVGVPAADRADFARALAPKLAPGQRLVWSPLGKGNDGRESYKAGLAAGDGMTVAGDIKAYVATGQMEGPRVDFDLGPADAVNFSGLTARHVGEALAGVFDGEVLYAARVMEHVEKSVTIFGELDQERAAEIALLLNSGSLPATLTAKEYYVDGASRAVPTR